MMRHIVCAVAGLVLTLPLVAQQERHTPERLRQQIAERFMTTYRQQAGLTDEQFARFQQVARSSWEARMQEDQRRRELYRALEGQLRPGIAANADSVARVLTALTALERGRAARAEADQQAYAEFLSPVQRAQLLIMMTRFERQVDQIMQQRMAPANPAPPGQRRNERPGR